MDFGVAISTISMRERSTGDQNLIDYMRVRVLIIERKAKYGQKSEVSERQPSPQRQRYTIPF